MKEANKQAEPVAFMYHDGPTPQEIPGDMMGTICFSRKRLFNCRNETPLYTRPAPAVAQGEAVAWVDEAGTLYSSKQSLEKYLPEGRNAFPLTHAAPAVAVNEKMLNALKLYIAHAGEPECAIWRHVQAQVKAAIAAAEDARKKQ